jgi:hypothetical protein
MKQIILLSLLLFSLNGILLAQSDSSSLANDLHITDTGLPSFYSFFDSDYECEKWDKYSEWEVQSPSQKEDCGHEWVYAEWKDVNESSGITTLAYCPCGCGDSENEARICSKCYLHQTRVHTYGYSQKRRQSEYTKILEALPKQ